MKLYYNYEASPNANIIPVTSKTLRTYSSEPTHRRMDKFISKRAIDYALKEDLLTKEQFYAFKIVDTNTVVVDDVKINKGIISYMFKTKKEYKEMPELDLERNYVPYKDAYEHYLEKKKNRINDKHK